MTFPPVSREPKRTESTNLEDGDHAEIRERLHSVPVVLSTYLPTAAFDGWLTDSDQPRLSPEDHMSLTVCPATRQSRSVCKRHQTHLKYGPVITPDITLIPISLPSGTCHQESPASPLIISGRVD